MRTFRQVLVNTLIANITTSFLWFALVFWVFVETRSVLVNSIVGGVYMALLAVMGVPFGSYVDRHRKKRAMVAATLITTVSYAAALAIFLIVPTDRLLDFGNPVFWVFVVIILVGAVVESMRALTLSTCVTLLLPDEQHAHANGLVGITQGIAFSLVSAFSGLSVGFLGMRTTIVIAFGLTLVSFLHLLTVRIPEPEIVHAEGAPAKVDFRGAYAGIVAVPGLLALVFFAAFNNLLGGAFIALLDPYGLSLVSVQNWGLMFGVLGSSFIIGGAAVAKWGLGPSPLRMLLLGNLALWTVSALFAIREAVWMLGLGIFLFMAITPMVEAAEQTVLQRVVPFEKQGRVFGFAQSVELAAAPVSSFIVGPLATFWVIPFAESTTGRHTLSWLLGEGQARGIALVFVLAGVFGVVLTLVAFSSKAYRTLTSSYADAAPAVTG